MIAYVSSRCKWRRATRNLVTRTIRFQETFPSTCGEDGDCQRDGQRDRCVKLCKKFSTTSRKPHRFRSLPLLLPYSPHPGPFRPLFRSNLERGLYDENGTQLYNTDRHVQAWQGGVLCGLKLEGAVRTSPLHVCISYALFPRCGCVQSAVKSVAS